jgi:hypothetical protein
MPKADIPQDLFDELGALAEPFVDREPADVIRRLVNDAKAKLARKQEKEEGSGAVYSTLTPPDLSFTKVLTAKIGGEAMPNPNWNRMMDHVIQVAAKKLKDADALSKLILAKHVKGEKTDQGYEYFPDAKVSVQGQDSNNAWRTTAHILKELGSTAEVTFVWNDNPKAAKPGQVGKFVIQALPTSNSNAVVAKFAELQGKKR